MLAYNAFIDKKIASSWISRSRPLTKKDIMGERMFKPYCKLYNHANITTCIL